MKELLLTRRCWSPLVSVAATVGVIVLLLAGCEGAKEAPPIPEGALRILSLSPNTTEILFRLGLGDEVVGVTDFCRYPPEALEKAKVGGLLNPNLEAMFALEPNLVVLLPAHEVLARKLQSQKIAVLAVPNDTMADVLESIESIGRIAGRSERAAALADSIRSAIESAKKMKPTQPWRVMIVVDRPRRGLAGIFVAGPGTYLDEVVQLIGGTNVFGQSLARYPEAGIEEILFRNPQVIIELRPSGVDPVEATEEARIVWRRIPGLSAAESGRIYALAGDHLVVPGPRIGRTIEEFSALFGEIR